MVPLELAGVVDGHKKSATALDVVRQRANGPHLCHRILLRRRYDVDPPGLHLGAEHYRQWPGDAPAAPASPPWCKPTPWTFGLAPPGLAGKSSRRIGTSRAKEVTGSDPSEALGVAQGLLRAGDMRRLLAVN